jgi:hypothetical protein
LTETTERREKIPARYICPLIPEHQSNLQKLDENVDKKLKKVLKHRDRNNELAQIKRK